MKRRLMLAGVITMTLCSTYGAAFAVAPGTHVAKVASPHHVGPDKVAWYDAGRASDTAPPAPMAGVGPKDLVVEGLTINTSLLPISLPIPPIRQVTAFVAMSFTLPSGATPASLTLRLTGSNTTAIARHLPSGVTPIACPVTSAFKSGLQQPASSAPKYDCSKRSTVGQLTSTGKAVTFPGISRLLTGDRLSLVILPGSLGIERLVFSSPTNNTLSLLSFSRPPPPTAASLPPPPVAPVSPTAPTKAPGGVNPVIPPVPPAPAVTAPAPTTSTPVVAPSPGLATVALSKPDDARDRARAIGMLLLLTAGVAWLVVSERRNRPAAAEMGVGRFRSARTGPPPTI